MLGNTVMNDKQILIIKNNIAWFMWIFTVIWSTLSLVFMDLAIRQPENLGIWGQIFVFSITGLGTITLLSFSFSSFLVCTVIDANDQTIIITKTYIRKKERYIYQFTDIEKIKIDVTKDSDGDPYYKLNLYLTSGDVVTIKEANYKENLVKLYEECMIFLGCEDFVISDSNDDTNI